MGSGFHFLGLQKWTSLIFLVNETDSLELDPSATNINGVLDYIPYFGYRKNYLAQSKTHVEARQLVGWLVGRRRAKSLGNAQWDPIEAVCFTQH